MRGGGGGSSNQNPGNANTAPVANAGTNQNISTGSTVSLDGSASTDPENDTLTYVWSFSSRPAGSAAALTDADTATPTFVADVSGQYDIQLVVKDGQADSDPDNVTVVAASGNSAPVANAGPDQNVSTGNTVTLDGSGSSDADADTITYNWTFASRPSGSSATLSDATAATPTFTADLDGDYVVQLMVNDGTVDSATDQVSITAATANSAPMANAGADQNVSTGDLVTLDASMSSDADADLLTYNWRFVSVPSGSVAALSNPTTATPSFTADAAGDYVAELIVNDGTVDSAPDRVIVTAAVANTAPVASAGQDQNVATGATVSLDGSGSSDADGDLLTYQWTAVSVPDGSAAVLDDATSVAPSFTADVDGDYVYRLVVNDGTVDSAPDTVTVTATTANSAPVANAGPDQNVNTGIAVTLDGSGSTDVDADALTYSWTFVSMPAGSGASLSNANTVSPTFTPDVDGDYVAELVVNDGTVNSMADRVTVTAATANSVPMADAGPDQSVGTGNTVTLDGSGSSDADSDALTYSWSFVSRPSGSSAALSDSTTVAPTFNSDVAGSFVAQLIVNDGTVDSAADQVIITSVRPDLSGVPFSSNGSFNITSTPPPAEFIVNQNSPTFFGDDVPFTLTAAGADFTIENLQAIDRNGRVTPRFDGLTNGMVIRDGQTVYFNLITPRTNGQTVNLLFQFSESVNGEVFSAIRRGSTN